MRNGKSHPEKKPSLIPKRVTGKLRPDNRKKRNHAIGRFILLYVATVGLLVVFFLFLYAAPKQIDQEINETLKYLNAQIALDVNLIRDFKQHDDTLVSLFDKLDGELKNLVQTTSQGPEGVITASVIKSTVNQLQGDVNEIIQKLHNLKYEYDNLKISDSLTPKLRKNLKHYLQNRLTYPTSIIPRYYQERMRYNNVFIELVDYINPKEDKERLTPKDLKIDTLEKILGKFEDSTRNLNEGALELKAKYDTLQTEKESKLALEKRKEAIEILEKVDYLLERIKTNFTFINGITQYKSDDKMRIITSGKQRRALVSYLKIVEEYHKAVQDSAEAINQLLEIK